MTLSNSEHDYGIAWELDSQASVTVRIFRDFLEKTGPFLDNEWNRADNRESWFHVAQNLLNTMDENDFKEYIKLLENINSFIEATDFTWANNASPEKGCQKKDYVPDGRRRPFTRQLANETFFHFLKFSQNAEDLSKLRRSRCWNKSFKFYDSTLWHRDLSIFLKGKFYIDYGVKWAAKDFEKPGEIHSFLYNCTERYDKINELD